MSDRVSTLATDLLVKELKEVAEWQTLGLYLGLSMTEIKEIEQDYSDAARRRMAMLDKWTRKENSPTWLKVIEALEHMSEVRLANQLRNKYCCTEAQIECETAASQTSLEPSDSQVTEKVLKVDKQDTVAKKIEEFGEKYLKLVGKSESALKSANPQPREIKRFSAYYEMASSDEVTTVEKLFDQLEPLYFLDYAMLEKIVKFFLDQAQPVVGELNDYIQELNEFKSSTTVQQFMESIEVALESHTTIERPKAAVTVTLRLVGGWLKKSITDLHLLLKELFREKSSVLSLLKILPGSVIVTFLAPQREADSLIMFAREKVSFMLQVGLCEVQVGDTVITSTQIETSNFSFESSLLKAVKRNDAENRLISLGCGFALFKADSDFPTNLRYFSPNSSIFLATVSCLSTFSTFSVTCESDGSRLVCDAAVSHSICASVQQYLFLS